MFCLCSMPACIKDKGGSASAPATHSEPTQPSAPLFPIKAPDFNSENALALVKKQVDFGPRVPGTEAQKKCRDFLQSELAKYADKVDMQSAQVKVIDGKTVPLFNIIGSFNTQNPDRILLSAHWDSRPWADQDDENTDKPILGANDGGSGVGILLEIARLLRENPPTIGVDIVFFDVEDYGKEDPTTYCLGSQHWAKNAVTKGYKARYGINLDMVGAPDAIFYREGHSRAHAPQVVDRVWKAASEGGYSSYFPFADVSGITDDHLFVTRISGVPTIDIIHYDDAQGFGKFWHTHDDDMDVVSKNTLKAVGQTLLTVIYNEK